MASNGSLTHEELLAELACLREKLAEADTQVAELHEIQQCLSESRELLNQTGKLARVGGWEIDIQTWDMLWTEATSLMYGLDVGYVPTFEQVVSFFTEEDRPVVREHVRKAIEEGKSFECEFPVSTLTGQQLRLHFMGIPVFEDGACVRLWGVVQDVTRQRDAEEKNRENEELYRLITENALDFIAVTNSEGTFEYISPSVHPISGFTVEEYKRFSTVERVHPDDIAKMMEIRQTHREAIEKGTPFSANVEFRVQHKDGHWIWLQAKTCTFPRFSGTYGYHILLVARDITEQKEAEKERLKLESTLQHAQKLESLGVLAGGIAHDFNNILAGIIGNADLALMEMSRISPAYEMVEDIARAAAHAADLTRQMLAYSGKGRFVVDILNIQDIIEEMVSMIEVAISRKAVVRYEFADSLPLIEADATQMRQVIMNLVTNASEAIGDKSGVISIRTGAAFLDQEYLEDTYLSDSLAEGDYVFVEVADTGCGMDRETQQKIFDPFFSTKFTGRGLGLAAVLGIVRGHNGAIKIYSEPGRGTTIKILLPASDKSVNGINHSANEQDYYQGSGTILLVDDEETVRAVGKRMLIRLGFEVVLARHGREAIEKYLENPDSITCVLLDLTMPHMDGESAFREFRHINSSLPVVLSSGYNEQEIKSRFAGKGLAGFIQKPYKLNVLSDILKKVLNGNGTGNLTD